MEIEWNKLITVDENWAVDNLSNHKLLSETKLVLRTHSIKYKTNKYGTKEFVSRLKELITQYVLNERAIESAKRNGQDPFIEALSFFGKVDPSKDGKFGELILYLLTESILKIPMVAFKITSSPYDQVKGSDGIFMGDYNGIPAILIGEAKIWGDVGKGIASAFKSLDRFHKPDGEDVLKYEYTVAKESSRSYSKGLTDEQLDHLADCLTFNSSANKARSIVHPVLIIYNDRRIDGLTHSTDLEAEKVLRDTITKNITKNFNKIKRKLRTYSKISEMYLEFFFIPVNDVEIFREDIFHALHNITWKDYKKQIKKKKSA